MTRATLDKIRASTAFSADRAHCRPRSAQGCCRADFYPFLIGVLLRAVPIDVVFALLLSNTLHRSLAVLDG